MADKVLRKRQAKGERCGTSRLNKEAVAEIRATHSRYSRENGAASLARKFGVTIKAVIDVAEGKTWQE
ncbi:hypothetical protein ACSD7O_19575 [Methylorubrum extorquens]|uniref:hypothetical protein n=1 Tax=Methylorubrum extorquens TaxID=408 RepID=UPI003F642ACE